MKRYVCVFFSFLYSIFSFSLFLFFYAIDTLWTKKDTSLNNNNVDNERHGRTRRTKRNKQKGKFVCSSSFFNPVSFPSCSLPYSARSTQFGQNRITTSTTTMLTTVDEEKQDKWDEQDGQHEKVSLCVLPLPFIQHLLLPTLLLLLLLLLDWHNLDGTGQQLWQQRCQRRVTWTDETNETNKTNKTKK